MKRYLIAAALIGALATPVLAGAEGFYVVFDNTTKKCAMMTTKPTDMGRYKMMGKADAHAAMTGMKECKM